MFRYFIASIIVLLAQEYEVGFPYSSQLQSVLAFLHRKYTLSFFSTIGLIAVPLITSLIIDSILGRRFLILDMLFGKRDKKSGADWEAFQVCLPVWAFSFIFLLSGVILPLPHSLCCCRLSTGFVQRFSHYR